MKSGAHGQMLFPPRDALQVVTAAPSAAACFGCLLSVLSCISHFWASSNCWVVFAVSFVKPFFWTTVQTLSSCTSAVFSGLSGFELLRSKVSAHSLVYCGFPASFACALPSSPLGISSTSLICFTYRLITEEQTSCGHNLCNIVGCTAPYRRLLNWIHFWPLKMKECV